MNETPLLKRFMVALPTALPVVRIFRRNVAHGKLVGGGYVRNGIKGQCDTYAVTLDGRSLHVELEAKSENGKLEEEQKAWRAFCLRSGIKYLLLVAAGGETPEQTVTRWTDELRRIL